MADQLIPANIVIGDRTYRIKIRMQDEEAVRATVKLINEKILEFKTQFSAKDMQDYIAMVLVWYATEQSSSTRSQLDTRAIEEKLEQMEQFLDKIKQG
ncbi:cell division protein ZapA [Flavihumibacter sp. RY-1]|jgi:cell division protein ZapA|uniref:Cell division protein ZapA n=1 Tax=Flavihumibacter fluminis TaxID=2909236 RepID=A0ABS9BLK9_9BACT|nr:cell division protein ZapA [Flavihumibacter fluminis]MBU7578137.1 cell division protein ZapA [Flavihumibacter sp.]MCF1716104.1 cell division protein ZapA [Flavihumibacter fluminis]